MNEKKPGAPQEASVQAPTGNGKGNVAVYHGYAWNIHMGADNILANAEQAMQENGVTAIGGVNQFRYGTGPKQQTVTMISALTTEGPYSFCVLTVASPNTVDAQTLRDILWDDLKKRLGITVG